jgi:hypothetical protein
MRIAIGSIAAAVAALAVIAYMGSVLNVGTPFNATEADAQPSTSVAAQASSTVEWVKVALILGIGGAVAAKVKGLFDR